MKCYIVELSDKLALDVDAVAAGADQTTTMVLLIAVRTGLLTIKACGNDGDRITWRNVAGTITVDKHIEPHRERPMRRKKTTTRGRAAKPPREAV